MYLGYWYSKKSIYDTAISSFNKALNAEVDEEQKAAIYTAIAEMYSFQNNFALSIEYLIKALPVYEKANDKYKYMKILANIGGLYRSAYNYEKAYTYIKKANDIAKELNSKEGIAKTCMDLGGININRGNFKEALALEHEALSAVKIAGNKSFEYGILQAIAIIYYYNTSNLINYDSALVYAKKAEQIAEEFGEKQMTYNAMETMASIYREQGRYKECEDASLKAWAIDSANITEAPALAANIIISSIYLDKRDQAKHFFWKYTEMVNQFNDESNHKTMIELETKYETQKKEMRIASLEKERRLYVWLGAAGVLLLISLGLILLQTQRNAKKKRRIIASEALLEGEIEERARIAKDLHDRLGGSLSAVKIELQSAESLQHVSDKLDECIKEVREITHNLMPRSLRLFGMKGALEDFSAQFPNVHFYFHGKEQRIKERLEFIVYCCANELVTNSIRYSGSENINIQLIQSEKHVSLTVQDDGCGFDEKTVTTGIGLKNIRDRIAACNGKLDIASAPGNGTETTIELKIES
jgi:signal transduction histidine kinase